MHYNPLVLQPNNEIWYTSTNNKIVEPYSGATMPFLDANSNNIPIVSNTYENGKGIIKLERNCYSTGMYMLAYNDTLSSINLPTSVINMNGYEFRRCTSLKNVSLPINLKSIGVYTFYSGTSLTEITIPDSVTSIGINAFAHCSKLSNITIKSETPPTLDPDAFWDIASDAVIYVPSGSVDAYKTSTNWSTYADKIQAISE